MIFLEEVARDIADFYQSLNQQEQENFAVVFPNKRSLRYFKKYFAKYLKKHSFITLIPWQQLLDSELEKFHKVPQIQLIAQLYLVVKRILGDKEEFKDLDFDNFFNLGQTILSDFNELDNYLVDVEKIFINIAELEQYQSLEFLTDEQFKAIKEYFGYYKTSREKQFKFFLELFSALPQIYEEFKNDLLDNKLIYNGLRNRLINQKLEQGEQIFTQYSYIAFVGFYALSKSERKIFDYLKNENKALFYWDYDTFYLNKNLVRNLGYSEQESIEAIQNVEHEAGFFLNMNLEKYPGRLKVKRNNILNTEKQVTVISTPRKVAQAKLLPQIFEQLDLQNNPQELAQTAVILLDETMLYPVLYSLPEYVDKINITLQFPLRLTSLFSFFQTWFAVVSVLLKGHKVYYKDLDNLSKLEIFQKVFPETAQKLQNFLTSTRHIYTNLPEELLDNDAFRIAKAQNHEQIFDALQQLIYKIYKSSSKFEREYIYAVYTEVNKFYLAIENLKGIELNNELIISILKQILYTIRVPFEANSIDGLQVMTIMETRNLDFKNIILLGMNEGIFPQISRPHTFLTETIRRYYGLPVLKFQDSLYAYMFYRLLHNSQNIFLLYDSATESGAGERSRFITQLENETSLIKHKLNYIEELNLSEFDFEIPQGKLSGLLEQNKSISASALINYLQCPRKFLYQYVLKLNPQPDFENEIQINEFGNIVHTALENFYTNIINEKGNRLITASDIEKQMKNLDAIIDKAIEEVLNNTEIIKQGQNIFYLYIIKNFVNLVLNYDKAKIAPFELVTLERQDRKSGFFYTVTLDNGKKITLQGIFDRLHKKGDILYLLDYKTGKKEHKFYFEKLFDKEKFDSQLSPIFQLFTYLLIYTRKNLGAHKIVPLLYDIPNMTAKEFTPTLTLKESRGKNIELTEQNPQQINQLIEEFEAELKNLLEEIYAPEQNFPKTTNPKNCDGCPFYDICFSN